MYKEKTKREAIFIFFFLFKKEEQGISPSFVEKK